MKKHLTFRRDCVDGKRLQELYSSNRLMAYSLTRNRGKAEELLLVFCSNDKTLTEIIEGGGGHVLSYVPHSNKLHRTGPFLGFDEVHFMDVWHKGARGVLIQPEVSNASAS